MKKIYQEALERRLREEMKKAALDSPSFGSVLQEVWLAEYELSVTLTPKVVEAQQEKDDVEYIDALVDLGLSFADISIANEVMEAYEQKEIGNPLQM